MLTKIRSYYTGYMYCSFNCDNKVFISNNRNYRCIKCNRVFYLGSFASQEEQITDDKEILGFIDKLYGFYQI